MYLSMELYICYTAGLYLTNLCEIQTVQCCVVLV